MFGPFDALIVAALVLQGVALAWVGYRSRGVLGRVRRDRTRAVAQLNVGPAEVSGTIRCVDEPLRNLAGKECVAIATRLGHSFRQGAKTYIAGTGVDVIEWASAELRDSTGACRLGQDHVLLIGPTLDRAVSPGDIARDRPDWWKALAVPEGRDVVGVQIRQTFVRADSESFVSGTAEIDSAVAPGDGYRDTHAQYRIVGQPDRPLVVAAYPERAVMGYLRRPLVMLLWAGVLSIAGAIAYVATIAALARAAGA